MFETVRSPNVRTVFKSYPFILSLQQTSYKEDCLAYREGPLSLSSGRKIGFA